jgi:UDP-N-acetylglucosamine 2-epimerase (non-hydrolysing)
VLVMRDTTERPEALGAGTVKLLGTNIETIVGGVSELLTNDAAFRSMSSAHNPYGDGRACDRIVGTLKQRFSQRERIQWSALSAPYQSSASAT